MTLVRCGLAAGMLLLSAAPAPAQDQPPRPAPPQRYFTTDFTLSNVDVARLVQRLNRLGIRIPFSVDGQVTAAIQVGIPWTTPGTARNYRLDGTLTSDGLVVSGIELRDVDATLIYRNGVLRLDRLQFRVPEEGEQQPPARPDDATGRFVGSAAMELIPRGDLSVDLTLNEIPIGPLAEQFPDLPELEGGRVSGTLTGSVPANRLRDLGAWTARGEATVSNLRAYGATLDSASATFTLAESLLTMGDLKGKIGKDISFAGAGTLNLGTPYEHTAELTVSVERLSALKPLAPELPWPERGGGTLSLTARETGTLEPFRFEATGDLAGAELRVGAVEIASVAADYTADADTLRITNLRAALYDGRLTGTASAPLGTAGLLRTDVRWRGIDLSPLIADLELLPIDRDAFDGGRTAGTLTAAIPVDQWRDPVRWQLAATAVVTGAEAGELEMQTARAELRIDDGVLTVPVLRARVAETGIEGTARVGLTAPYPYAADLQVVQLMLGDAARLPQALRPPVPVRGRINLLAELEGTLQPLRITGDGTVSAVNLALDGLTADAASFLWSVDGKAVHVRDLDARLYGGTLSATATLPLSDAAAGHVAARWRGVHVGPFAKGVGARLPAGLIPENLAGEASGRLDLQIPEGRRRNPAQWSATAEIALSDGRAWGWDIRTLTAAAQLADETLTITGIDGAFAGGELAASAQVQLAAPHRYEAQVRLAGRALDPVLIGTGEVRLPARIAGPYRLEADARGTLQPLRIEGNGILAADGLAVGEIVADSLRTRWQADGRRLRLTELDAQIAGGQVSGAAVVPLDDQTAGSASLRWERLQIAPMAKTLNEFTRTLPEISTAEITGTLSGEVNATIPAGTGQDFTRWQADARAVLTDARVWGWVVERFAADLRLRERTLTLTRLNGDFGESQIEGTGRLRLVAPYDYAARLRVLDGDLSNFNTLPPPELPVTVAGRFRLSADVQGTLQPLRARGEGDIVARDVSLARLSIPSLELDWTATGTQLEIRSLEAQLAGGRAAGEATLPLVPEAAGDATIRWGDVEIAQVASLLGELPVEVGGRVAGSLNAAISPAGPGGARSLSARSSISSAELQLGPLVASDLNGTLVVADELLQYRFDGRGLDGAFKAEGDLAISERADAPDDGTLRLRGISLGLLSTAVGLDAVAGPLAGTLDATLDYEHTGADGLPAGRGTFDLIGLRWRDRLVAERLAGRLLWRGMRLLLDGITGRVLRGDLLLAATVDLQNLDRTVLELNLRGASVERADVLFPDLSLPVAGNFDLQLRGSLGPRWRAVGRIALPQGRFDALRLGSLRLPILLTYDPATGMAVAEMRESVLQVAGGRVTGTLRAVWSRRLDLEADLSFSRIDLQTVLRQLGTQSRFGRGRISGNLTLAGRNVRSFSDLSGRVDARLENVEPRSVPIVSATVPYLTGGATAYGRIDRGELHARIAGGVVRIQEFTLDGQALQLYADGTISEAGRLDLNVVANTNVLGTNRFVAQALLEQIPPVGPPPVVVLIQANRFLSNRVIYLHVSGTLARPVVRPRPVPQLTEQAVRFFLSQSVGQ